MTKGGARLGAGRKPNSGVYGEKTVPKRIPVTLIPGIEQFIEAWKMSQAVESPQLKLPLFSSRVSAGFPSPADDFLEAALDLNQHLIHHPAATFFVRTSGDSMIGVGIQNNDILVVDRSLEAKSGSIVIAVVNGELTVKRLLIQGKQMVLKAENPNYPDLQLTEEMAFQIWGVVTSVIHEFKGVP